MVPAAVPSPKFQLKEAIEPSVSVEPAELNVTVEVARTFRPASDPRDLGLAFGVFEVR